LGFFAAFGLVVVFAGWCFGAGFATVAFRIVDDECFAVAFAAVRAPDVPWAESADAVAADEAGSVVPDACGSSATAVEG
jgi:hypothetical protein